MADGRSKALQALRRLIKSRRAGDDAWNIIDQLRLAENPDPYADRAAALIGGVILDHALQVAISTHFIPLEATEKTKIFEGDHEREGILGSYYSRIYIAYALRIFGQHTLQDMNTIRSIRNAFAHFHGELSFKTPEIEALCEFEVLEKFGDENWISLENKVPTTSREKFLATVYVLVLYLLTGPNDKGPKVYDQVGTPPLFS
jgi:hypothetical protein